MAESIKKYALCRVSVASVRVASSDKSELDTQLLFGEPVEILSQIDNWVKLRTLIDNYEGWADGKQLLFVSEPPAKPQYAFARELVHWAKSTKRRVLISRGSILPDYKDGWFEVDKERFEYSGEVTLSKAGKIDSTDSAIALAKDYLGVPYLWGGRSAFGIDCSGFIQVVFNICGINLPRNASQQVTLGENIPYSDRQPGDLVFFAKDSRVFHVGMLLDNDNLIHASGEVRVDPITEQGIYHAGQITFNNNVFAIRRFFSRL